MAVKLTDCGDCGVSPGNLHEDNCDVARCKNCGAQLFLHSGFNNCDSPENTTWTGEWPGVLECRILGWYTSPESFWGETEDLNRLVHALATGQIKWDREHEICTVS